MKKVIWIVLAVILVGAVGFKVYQKVQQRAVLEQEAQALKGGPKLSTAMVKVLAASPQPIKETLQLTGEIEADSEITVQPEISGRVLSILVDEGQLVKAKQLVAVMDDETIRLQIQQSEASLAGIKANVRQGELNAARIRTEKERCEELLKQKYISQQDFDNVENSYLAAQSSVEAQKAQLASATKNLELLRVQLGKTRVYSPITGYVLTVPATLGLNLTSGSTLMTVAALDPVKLVFNVDQRDTAKITKGVPVKFKCDLYPDLEFNGAVREVAPSYDAKTRTLSLAAILRNPGNKLLPGLFGSAEIMVGGKTDALVVPAEAVVNRDGQSGVFVVNQKQEARFQPVATGLQSDGQMEITTGLQAGDLVVILGQNRLRDGQTVQLLKNGKGDGKRSGKRGRKPGEGKPGMRSNRKAGDQS
ncbi:MAG TPA: efflux RND transporter periplasmic adaptor subunit [Bacillota bacterium]|nr:efflux RND transporter periplasmic adaptor subunit [Bacillota bacterium]